MTLRPCLAGLTLLVAGCSSPEPAARPAQASVVQVADAVCRPTPPGRRMTLCYLTLTASKNDALIEASSPRAGRVALHDVPFENGMVVLTPRSGPISLPAGQAVRLAPGGQALALQGVQTPMIAGQTVQITLTFNLAPAVETVARVEAEPAA
jgi:copper(I)-binding protein